MLLGTLLDTPSCLGLPCLWLRLLSIEGAL